jgi:hypothetical protein
LNQSVSHPGRRSPGPRSTGLLLLGPPFGPRFVLVFLTRLQALSRSSQILRSSTLSRTLL